MGVLLSAESIPEILHDPRSDIRHRNTAVTAINELTGLERTTQSDSGGRFNIPRLPVGNYRVEVKVDGFRPFATTAFRLNVEDIRQ